MSQPSWREQQRLIREEAIVDAAHALLAEKGYDDMSMDELAAVVGIAKATLYQHFRSKEDVAVGVIIRLMQRIEKSIRLVNNPSEPAVCTLESALREGLRERLRLWKSNITLPIGLTHNHPAFQQQQQRLVDLLTETMEKAKREGYLDTALSIPVIVRMAMGLFRIDFQDLLSTETVSLEELIHTLSTIILRGMRFPGLSNRE